MDFPYLPIADGGLWLRRFELYGCGSLFGTMADFDALLVAAHSRGLRIILDFVPNHTSDQHPWFLASRSSRGDAKRTGTCGVTRRGGGARRPAAAQRTVPQQLELAVWRFQLGVGRGDRSVLPPFLFEAAADLNWRNPDVRAAMYEAMRFWLDKGVDAFRMDVLWLLIKDEQFRDNPTNLEYSAGMHEHAQTLPLYNADQPGTHRIVAAMRALMDSYGPTLPGNGQEGGGTAVDPETRARWR